MAGMHDPMMPSIPRHGRLYYGVWIATPLLLLLAALMIGLYIMHRRNDLAILATTERYKVALYKTQMERDIQNAVENTLFLTRLDTMQQAQSLDEVVESRITRDFFAFMQTRPLYTQIRLLTPEGKERIRIRVSPENKPIITRFADLQDARGHLYFEKAKELPPGEVFISPLDLNREKDEIVTPHEPVLRFSTPVITRSGRRLGYLIVNLDGSRFLDPEPIRSTIFSHFSLINILGQHLPTARVPVFTKDEPELVRDPKANAELWRLMKQHDAYQYYERGLITFTSVYPEQKRTRHQTLKDIDINASDEPYRWILISHIPNIHKIYPFSDFTLTLFAVSGGLACLILTGAWLAAGMILRRMELQEALQEAALQDALTGLCNRRFGILLLEQALSNALRHGHDLTLCVIDVNFLKQTNDTYGHTAGDELLQKIAILLKEGLREVDIVARYGGDEFFVTFPETDLAHATNALSRIRERAHTQFGALFPPHGIDFAFGGTSLYETTSSTPPTIEALFEQADIAMYAHKRMIKEGLRATSTASST